MYIVERVPASTKNRVDHVDSQGRVLDQLQERQGQAALVLNLDVDAQTLGALLDLRFPDRTVTDAGIQFDEKVFFVSISPSAVEFSNRTAYGDVIKVIVTLILCDRTEGDDGTLTGSWRSSLFSRSTSSTSVGA